MVKKVVGMKPFGKFSRGAVQIFVLGELGGGCEPYGGCLPCTERETPGQVPVSRKKELSCRQKCLRLNFFYKFS